MITRSIITSSATVLALAGSPWSAADEIPVGPGESIQAAIESASDGDEIVVAAGCYAETIDFLGKAIVVRSADGPEVTKLDGTGLEGSVVTFASGETSASVLEGFTITGDSGVLQGDERVGLGMYVESAGPIVRTCWFVENLIDDFNNVFGAGLYAIDASVAMFQCRFVGNVARHGGGIRAEGGSLVLTECVFESNESTFTGGGITCQGVDATIAACTFRNNSTSGVGDGGGVYVNFGKLDVTSSHFEANHADRGGGIAAFTPSGVIRDSTFVSNVGDPGSAIKGGSLIRGCAFVKNAEGCVELNDGRIESCRFGLNLAPVIRTSGSSEGVIANSVFVGNGVGGDGGVIRLSGDARVTNCTIALNDCVGVEVFESTDQPVVANTLVWSNTGGSIDIIGVVGPDVSHSLVEGSGGSGPGWDTMQFGLDGGGNIDGDPLIVDLFGPDALPGTGDEDFSLLPGSPCIDAGDDAAVPEDAFDLDGDSDFDEPLPLDFLGGPRFVGAFVDIGAVEFQGDDSPCPDTNGDGEVDVLDLVAVVVAWGTADPAADVDGDGTVGVGDLIAVITGWGSCP